VTGLDPQATCGCCERDSGLLPEPPRNPPALPAIDYRLGTFARFREAMARRIAREPRLEGWTARRRDDYGIALIEMWAYIADILTFYEERTANEAFLRTATRRESVRRLVGLLGYRPSPGLAAVAHTAYTLEPAAQVTLRERLRLQSVPADGERPQKFETVEQVVAREQLNRIPVYPAPDPIEPLAVGRDEAPVRPGSAVPPAGRGLVAWDPDRAELKEALAARHRAGRTLAAWTPPVQGTLSVFGSRLAMRDRQFGIFGRNEPTTYLKAGTETIQVPTRHGRTVARTFPKFTEETQPASFPTSDPPVATIPLDGIYEDIAEGSEVLIVADRPSSDDAPTLARRATVVRTRSDACTYAALTDTVTRLDLDMRATAKPVLLDAASSTNNLLAFVAADDGAVWTRRRASAAGSPWGPWRSLGGDVVHFGAMRQPNHRATVFAASLAGSVWERAEQTDGRWADWERVDAPGDDRFDRVAAAVDGSTGRTHLVARAEDGRLRHTSRGLGGAWSAWGELRPGDAVEIDQHRAVYAGNKLRVVAIGADGTLRATEFSGTTFSPWQSFGGAYDLLAATVRESGRLDVLARSVATLHAHQLSLSNAGVWSAVADRDGRVYSLDVAATAGVPGMLVAAGRGADGIARIAIEPTPGMWISWRDIATTRGPDVAVGRNAGGLVEAVLRSDDGTLAGVRPPASQTDIPWNAPDDLGVPMWAIEDRRTAVIHELVGSPIELGDRDFAARIDGSLVYVPLDRLDAIETGRRIVLDDDPGEGRSAVVTDSSQADLDGDGDADHLAIAFTPALDRSLETETARLLGNVAVTTHGASQPVEVLGDGDASAPLQAFTLERHPLTYVPSPGAPHGAKPELEVRVDGILWEPVEELYGRAPDEHVYVIRTDDEGRATIRFGDGRNGARPATGRGNIRALYRVGIGEEGNLRAGALRNPLDRPTGMRSAVNPARAEGGADPETADQARAAGPDSVRTFGRIVSLRDHADAAREFAAVTKARASLTWEGGDEQVQLVVAGPGGDELGQTALRALVADLDSRRDPNRGLRVVAHDPLPVVVTASVSPAPDREADAVVAAARQSLIDLLAFDRQDFGAALHLSEVYAALQRAPGVVWADVTELRAKSDPPATAPAESVPVGPSQIAQLEDRNTDVTVTAT
jgi:hypothetical protein